MTSLAFGRSLRATGGPYRFLHGRWLRQTDRRALAACALALAAVLGTGCAGEHGTIGAMVAQRDDGRLFVRDVPPGLAADKAGLRPDDEILLIDGADVRAMDAAHIHQALSGDVGEPVNLTIVRGKEVLRVTLRRTESRKYGGPTDHRR